MIRPAHRSQLQPPVASRRRSAYGRPFWLAYAANLLVMVAISLLFRYADFVALLGGDELQLGWIVGIGMVGSLAVRAVLGTAIDRYGAQVVWVGSLMLFAATCFAHLTITSCHGPAIYLVRIGCCCSLAGVFGALMTFISGRASGARMAEMVGMVGTAGFLGQVLGTQLGDLLLGTDTIGPSQIRRMFLVAGGLGCCSAVFAWLATRGQTRPTPHPHPRPPLLQLLRQYHPGPVFLVGVAMGIGLGMPGTFLRTYTDELDIRRIGTFFGVYAATAIVTRVLTRRLPERLGTTPMILCGLGMLALSQFLLMLVRSEPWLVVPGVGYGIAHAVLFPSVVAAGSRAFPDRHRGLGTTVILATWDLGTLVGAPMIGGIHRGSTLLGLPPYPMVFVSLATLLTAVALFFLWTERRKRSPQLPVANMCENCTEDAPGAPELIEAGERR